MFFYDQVSGQSLVRTLILIGIEVMNYFKKCLALRRLGNYSVWKTNSNKASFPGSIHEKEKLKLSLIPQDGTTSYLNCKIPQLRWSGIGRSEIGCFKEPTELKLAYVRTYPTHNKSLARKTYERTIQRNYY